MSSDQSPGKRFSRNRLGPGYDVEEVDAFLVLAEQGTISAADIRQKQFSSVLWRGYDEQEVDDALDELAARRTAKDLSAAKPPGQKPRPKWSRLLRR